MLRFISAAYFGVFLIWTAAWGALGRHDLADVSAVCCLIAGVTWGCSK